MKKQDFLQWIEENSSKNLIVKLYGNMEQNITMVNYKYELKEDRLIIRGNINLDFIIINLNIVRNIKNEKDEILIILDDNIDTLIKISAN